ncbi:hypothetical protein OIV83_003127 [Microbotryomycetes sp. JL201]|nr:hypothetical protein OIV83_003127 [Microbotryomycetes sp. JL201]
MSSRTLSKGTLGLKFMNRIQPSSPASTPAVQERTANSPANDATTSATSTARPFSDQTEQSEKVETAASTTWTDGQWSKQASTSGPVIVQESSLLAFPLIGSSSFGGAASSSSSTAHSSAQSYYSSMPFTSSAISGRRSFGGANIDIEQLNNPDKKKSAHKQEEQSMKEERKESDTQRKKRLRREREDQVLTGRARANNSATKKAPQQLVKDVKGKQPAQTATPSKANHLARGECAKPRGFEGARKTAASKTNGTGKAKSQDDVRWNEAGVQREWDEGKARSENDSDSDSDENDDNDDDSIDKAWNGLKQEFDESSDVDQDSDDSERLVITPADTKTAKRELDVAFQQAEAKLTGSKKSKGNKKRRQ